MKSMTAKEMALTSHNLDRSGDFATTASGEKFAWDDTLQLWVRLDAASIKQLIKKHRAPGCGLARGGDYYTRLFRNTATRTLKAVLAWTYTQDAYVERFVGGNIICLLRVRA